MDQPNGQQLRFAIRIPQYVADGEFDPASLRRYLARAEALGFESAWAREQTLGSMPHLGPIETMTYAAAGVRPASGTGGQQVPCAAVITAYRAAGVA